jgi:predicted dinucleotide-binding enzyme
MDITRNGTQPSARGPVEWFTGSVRIDSAFQRSSPARVADAMVTFEPGARTAWHADDTGLTIGHTSSGAEELAQKLRRAKVVSAFGTVPSEVFFDVFAARRRATRPSMAHCGDDDGAKGVAATLMSDVGFEPVDAGPLRIARYLEPFALLMGQLAYEGDGGPEIAYRFERFEKSIAQKRDMR